MNRLNYRYFAPLAAMLATLFLFSGCLPDKEKAEARRQERLSREVFAIQEELILTGDTAVAIAKLEKLNDKHPEHLEVIDALGAAYKEKGDSLMAAFFYDYAFELAPENPDFALQAARAHEANGSSAEALSAYRAYLKLNPTASGLWRTIALLEAQEGNHQLALSAYLEALRADKVQPTGEDKLGIAILYHKLGNQPQAQRWYEDLLTDSELEPQVRVDGMIGLFDLALRQKQWDRALELMHAIDVLSPSALQEGDYASAYAELADWDKRRKEAEAEAARVQAERTQAAEAKAKAEKEAAAAATSAATAATESGSVADSATPTGLASAAPADGASAGTQITSAEASVATASTAAAESSVAVDVVDAPADGQLADSQSVSAAQGAAADKVSAAAKAESAKAADTNAGAADQSSAAEEAEAAVAAATAAELAERGKSAFESEDFTIAVELLERSAKLNPNNGEVLDMLSRASFRTGLFPQAERYAMLATYAEPQNVNYRLEYLRAYQRNHPPASMLQQLISAREAFPKDPNVTLALARGYEYIAQRKSLAAGLYHEYLQMAPESVLADDIRQKLLEWEM